MLAIFHPFSATRYLSGPRNIYLVNFACYKPKAAEMCSRERFLELSRLSGRFSEESLSFRRKTVEISGCGDMTYLPESLLQVPPKVGIAGARKEAKMVMFGAVDQLLAKTGVKAKDIGILVVNSTLFVPIATLSAMIVNLYKLSSNILSYNLGGMGFSAGVISIDLGKDLLLVHPNSYALVVSTENITLNWYTGNKRSMLVSNCLFRVGAAALLLSNRSFDLHRSKYQLLHVLRTPNGANDKSYNCIFQQEDETKTIGVNLSKDLTSVAKEALKTNIAELGPRVLPISEKLRYLATLVARNIFKMNVRTYIPNFNLAFEHFCIHTGGRAVLDEIEKKLELSEWYMEPSRMTLYRFGNTSSSFLWYELAYCEAKGRVRKGDRIWQIALGAGFKSSSAVWHGLNDVNPAQEMNPWVDEIAHFPVYVPKVADTVNSS